MTDYPRQEPGGSSAARSGPASRPPSEPEGEDPEGYEAWLGRSRMVLTPVAAPSILGLFGFASSTFMVASNLAGWWGDTLVSPVILAPL
ncbi:hypothetical protein ACF1B0_35830, partial [Streptomyces anandii]